MTHQSYKETFWYREYVLHSPLQPALSQLQSYFWPPLLPAGPHLGLQPQGQELVLVCCVFPHSKCPFHPAVPLLSVQALQPLVNWVFPLLEMCPWSCVAAHPTWTSSFCLCLLCDRRHLKYLPKMNNQPLPLQSRGDLPTAAQKLGSNPHLKDRWIKNATDTAAENS